MAALPFVTRSALADGIRTARGHDGHRMPALLYQRFDAMLDVFYTVDVEVWCDGWNDLDARFADSFRRHIYGSTPRGDFGLPLQLELLRAHGLKGAFFVEPLFATRFGLPPLQEIIGLLADGQQDIQLHLHTEWVDEAPAPILEDSRRKRQFLRHFSPPEQRILIAEGLRLLRAAGGGRATAFRAGNFGFDIHTLGALAANGMRFDSSYNACTMGPDSGLRPGTLLVEPVLHEGIFEYPVTVFSDGTKRLRPMQITACSWGEMEGLLWRALEARRQSVVIVSHSFELLDEGRTRPDATAVQRFRSLCTFLDRHRDVFRSQGFGQLQGVSVEPQPQPLSSPAWKTAWRMAEQAYRRLAA